MPDASARGFARPVIALDDLAVDDERGVKLRRVAAVRTNRLVRPADANGIVRQNLEPGIRKIIHVGVMLPVGDPVAHRKARELSAVPLPARVKKAVARHGQQSAMRLSDLPDRLAVAAEPFRHFNAQARRNLRNGENAPEFFPFHAHEQHLFPEIYGQHLLVHRCADACPGLIEARLVDVDSSPAVCERLRVLVQIRLHGVPVDLPENIIEVVLRDLRGRLFRNGQGHDLCVRLTAEFPVLKELPRCCAVGIR